MTIVQKTSRVTITSLAAALLMGLCVAPGFAAETVRVGKAIALPFDFTPLDVGIAKGFYQKHGLEIEAVNFAGSAKL